MSTKNIGGKLVDFQNKGYIMNMDESSEEMIKMLQNHDYHIWTRLGRS